jgi:NAD kinase
MKKRHPLLFVILLTLLLSVACNLGVGTRTVHINEGNTSLTIEYKGEVFFTADGTAIDEISPGGYIKYRRNGKKFIAEPNDSGNVKYKLYFGDRRLDLNDSAAKAFFKTALNEIAEHYER